MAISRSFVIKRLTKSDNTLFGYHARLAASRQKAINLNSKKLREVFPTLTPGTYGIDLHIFGPSVKGPLNLQRKIVRESKNWRLNGEVIWCDDNGTDRFVSLDEGDYAVMVFEGEGSRPIRIRTALITNAEDATLHAELNTWLQRRYTTEISMEIVQQSDLESLSQTSAVPDDQNTLARLLSLFEEIDESTYGGGHRKVDPSLPRERLVKIKPEEVQNATNLMAEIGTRGEELVDEYLANRKAKGEIQDYSWVSREHATAPYDFEVVEDDGSVTFIDAKTTGSKFDRPIHVSYPELIQITRGTTRYLIYRVYNLNTATMTADLKILDPGAVMAQVLNVIENLPPTVVPDSFSINPASLPELGVERDLGITDPVPAEEEE